MKSWILVLYLFSESIFFGTLSLFSTTHTPGSSGFVKYYIALAVVIGSASMVTLIKKMFGSNTKIPLVNVWVVVIFITLFLNITISYYEFNHSPVIAQIAVYFFAFTFPALVLALSINENDVDSLFDKMKYVNLFLTVCFSFSFLQSNDFSGVGGANHLMIGYTMAALFPYNIIKITQSKQSLSKLFYLSLCMANVLFTALSGARGALVSVFITFLVLMYVYVLKRRSTLKFIMVSFILSTVGYYIIKTNDFRLSFERLLYTFNSDLNQASSGRTDLYGIAYRGFLESPIFGNGLGSFGYDQGFYIYPHNIVLEILHDFGLIGFIVFFIVMIAVIKKVVWLLRQDNASKHILAFLFISSFVSLMFSGSYLTHLQFWVSSILVLTTSKKRKSHQLEVTAKSLIASN